MNNVTKILGLPYPLSLTRYPQAPTHQQLLEGLGGSRVHGSVRHNLVILQLR